MVVGVVVQVVFVFMILLPLRTLAMQLLTITIVLCIILRCLLVVRYLLLLLSLHFFLFHSLRSLTIRCYVCPHLILILECVAQYGDSIAVLFSCSNAMHSKKYSISCPDARHSMASAVTGASTLLPNPNISFFPLVRMQSPEVYSETTDRKAEME